MRSAPAHTLRRLTLWVGSLLCALAGAHAQHDLSLQRLASPKYVEQGDVVTVTFVVTNDLGTDVDDIAVAVGIPAALQYLRHSPSETFDPATGIWDVGALSYREFQTTITIDFRVVGEGVINLPAEISAMGAPDVDSTPGNGDFGEDDYKGTCFSVPVRAECGQSVRLEAPAGAPGYQWFRDGLPIPGATTQAIDVGESGSYNFELVGAPTTCALGSCCEAVVTFDSISVAMSQPTVCTGGFDTVRFDVPEVDEVNFDQDYAWSSVDDPTLRYLSCADCPKPVVVVDGPYPSDSLRYAVSVVTTDRLGGQVVCSAQATLVIEVLQAPVIQFLTPVYACAEACVDLEIATDLPTASVRWDGPNLRTPDGYVMEYCPRAVSDYTTETFVVTAIGTDGCQRVDSVDVITVPAIALDVASVGRVCQFESADLIATIAPVLPADSVVVTWTEEPANPGSGANLVDDDALAVATAPLAPGDYAFRVSVQRLAPDGSLVCAPERVVAFRVEADCAEPRLGGYAWRDENGDGLRQGFEAPMAGLAVELLDAAANPLGPTTTTDAAGFYEFTALAVGDYRVRFATLPGFDFTLQDVGADEFVDSDADAAGVTDAFAATYDEALHLVGAGYDPDCQLDFVNVRAAPSDCGEAVGSLSFTVTGAVGTDLRYTWAPAVSSGPSASGLSAGDYEVMVFDSVTGCAHTETLTVPGTRAFTLATSSTPAACPGGGGGSITLDTDGGTAPFTIDYAGPNPGSEVAGGMPYTVSGLPGGTYSLTVTDVDGCRRSAAVDVSENELLVALDVIDFIAAGCNGARDGSFEVEVTGFDTYYDLTVDGLTVVTGATDATTVVGGQAAGPHVVEATDVNGCTQQITFPLPGGQQPIDLATIVIADVDCNGATTGSISSSAGEAYEVRDSRGQLVGTLPQNALAAGIYTLVDRSRPGCLEVAEVTVDEPAELRIALTVRGEQCAASDGRIAADVAGGSRPYTFEWDGGLSVDSVRSDLVNGQYALRVIDANGCTIDTLVAVPDLCTPLVCAPYFTVDTVVLDGAGDRLEWCVANFELPTGRAFTLDGSAIAPDPCTRAELVYYNLASLPGDGADGPYIVEFWFGGEEVVVAERFDSAAQLAALLDAADAWGRWAYDGEENTIRGGQPDRAYGEIEVTHVASSRTVFLSPRTLSGQLSVSVPLGVPGAYTIATVDPDNGCTDSVHVITRVEDVCAEAFTPASLSTATPYCDDVAPVCIPVPFDLLATHTLSFDGTVYVGAAEPCATDAVAFYDIAGVTFAGGATLQSWFVDGRTESARIASPEELAAVMRAFDGEPWRYDAVLGLLRGGNPDRDYRELRIEGSDAAVVRLSPGRDIDDGTRVLLPTGSSVATLTDPDGCVGEFSVTLRCSADTPPSVDTVRWTLGVGFTDTLCISTAELPGELTRVENLCFDASGERALVDVVTGTCLAGEGVEEGSEEYCLLACDDNGVCDTTIVLITVLSAEEYIFPQANPDRDSLDMNGVVLVDVLENDSLRGTFASLEITEYPRYGQARVLDGEIEYIADPQFCGVDNLIYELCNTRGCDTAIVDLFIECDQLIIYNGISPDFDDVNETFTVLGIEQFPDNRMEVYNRWGNLVFEADGYDNSWRGTSFDGDELGEGTYFYVFQDGRGRTYTGYLYIKRY